MTFQWPILLWGLLLVPLAVALYLFVQRRRVRYAVRFTNLDLLANLVPRSPGWRRHVPPVLFLLGLSLLLISLARPQATVPMPRNEANVVLVMDTSSSMEATDVSPNRLSAAQKAARAFLDRMPNDFRVGLVTFSTQAQVLSLPTTQHKTVGDAIGSLEAGGGTAMGDGLARGTEITQPHDEEATGQQDAASKSAVSGGQEASSQEADTPAAVVLLSDGDNNAGQTEPMEAAERARELGVPVFTVALGTDDGEVEINEYGRTWTISVPPDKDTLRRIAETTGGEFFASTSEADLVSVYEDIGSSLRFVKEHQEVTVAFVAMALALLLAGGTLSLLWFHRLL